MTFGSAVDHLQDVVKLAAGAGIVAVTAYFGHTTIQTSADVQAMQHDLGHQQESDRAVAADISDIRRSLEAIDRTLGTLAGQQEVEQANIIDLNKSMGEFTAKLFREK